MLLPNRYNCFINHLNHDFEVGYHHFEPFKVTLCDFVTQEFDRFSRRFQVTEKNGALVLTLELPGFAPADLSVKLDRGLLTVTAKSETTDTEEHSVNVGRDIDPDKVEATLDKGILTITLHRLDSAKSRDIPVK